MNATGFHLVGGADRSAISVMAGSRCTLDEGADAVEVPTAEGEATDVTLGRGRGAIRPPSHATRPHSTTAAISRLTAGPPRPPDGKPARCNWDSSPRSSSCGER